MPTNTPIPTVTTGQAIAAATQNDVAVLNNAIGLFGATGTPLYGSIPPSTAPNFYMQFGVATGTTGSNGALNITFPSAFPNCLMGVFPMPTNLAGALYSFGVVTATANLAAVTAIFYYLNNGAGYNPLNTSGVSQPYIAIGA